MKRTLSNGATLKLEDGYLSYVNGDCKIICLCDDIETFEWIESEREMFRELLTSHRIELIKIKARKAGMVEYKEMIEQI